MTGVVVPAPWFPRGVYRLRLNELLEREDVAAAELVAASTTVADEGGCLGVAFEDDDGADDPLLEGIQRGFQAKK